jgi:hypothetical protein
MTKGNRIWIATLTASAATAAAALASQPVLVSVGLGLTFSLANDLLFSLAMRILSWRIAMLWPKATAFVLPAAWFVKQGVLFVAAYGFFIATRFPILPFAFAVLGYQIARVALMIVQPDQFARFMLPEQHVAHQALTGGNAE